MMRIAALYDVHGNLPALDAVLRDVRAAQVDLVVMGGDVVPGPMPRECLARLLELDLPTRFIHGNCDREVLAVMRGAEPSVPEPFRETFRWSAEQLRPDYEPILASWPPTVRLTMPALGDVLFCHATPRNDTELFTHLTPEDRLIPIFDGAGAAVAVCGHTHMQFDRMVGRTRVVNAGSVGMPFGEPGAYWALFGPDVQLRRTTYDRTAAAEQIRRTRYPQAAQFAEQNVLHPPSEEAMLEAFARAELTG